MFSALAGSKVGATRTELSSCRTRQHMPWGTDSHPSLWNAVALLGIIPTFQPMSYSFLRDSFKDAWAMHSLCIIFSFLLCRA